MTRNKQTNTHTQNHFHSCTDFRVRLLMKNGGDPNIIPNDGVESTTYV